MLEDVPPFSFQVTNCLKMALASDNSSLCSNISEQIEKLEQPVQRATGRKKEIK